MHISEIRLGRLGAIPSNPTSMIELSDPNKRRTGNWKCVSFIRTRDHDLELTLETVVTENGFQKQIRRPDENGLKW